ncbi:MAG: hypothetical protein LBU95_02305 [Rikenellaceae bacterium]|jgi:hypothetical protein|nr:hypothetical protein [Rikenellaceae bacterium]
MKKILPILLLTAFMAGTGLRAADLAADFRSAVPNVAPASIARFAVDITAKYPGRAARYLVRVDTLIEGGENSFAVPAGKVMSACITRQGGYSTTVVTDKVELIPANAAPGSMVEARMTLPRGKWRLQLFLAVVAPACKYPDPLDSVVVASAVKNFYGTSGGSLATNPYVITTYDDNSYGNVPGARAWSEGFNERYKRIYKVSPEAVYPALFEDTGLHTATDRIKMFSLRDQMNAEGFPKINSEWAAKSKVHASGAPAGVTAPNPLLGPGDAIKYFKYQELPMADYANAFRNQIDGLAILASAAYNYDKAEVVCRAFDDFRHDAQNDADMLYRVAMDAYARGANRLMPGGTWYGAITADGAAKDYTAWITRCEQILRGSRHVAQVGILYPIADLQARYDFTHYAYAGPADPVRGNDYYTLLQLMTTQARRDFTLVHPEVLDEKCVVDNGVMRLDNEHNFEEWRIVIVPWCNTICPSNLEKLSDFATRGGTVLFVGCTPMASAVRGEDNHVQQLVRRIMASGRGHLIEWPDRDNIRQFIASHLPNPDVQVEIVFSTYKMGDAALDARPESFRDHAYACNYIHKVKDGRDFYFFANPTDCALTVELIFTDTRVPQVWDPHTCEIKTVESTTQYRRRAMQLELPPVKSAFVVFGD